MTPEFHSCRKFFASISIFLLFFLQCMTSTASEISTAVEVSTIVESKELAESSVLNIKDKFKPYNPEYVRARKLYAIAQSRQNGWVAAVKIAIRSGDSKRLEKNMKYAVLSDKASKAANDFVNYAESVTSQSKSVTVLLSEFGILGIKIWRSVYAEKTTERERHAEMFSNEARWRKWEDIK